jgi:hypothetical protein
MRKTMKPGRRYFIINIDEPYAEDIYKVLKKGQMKKGQWPEGNISFEEWVKITWAENTRQTPRVMSDREKPQSNGKIKKRFGIVKTHRGKIAK